MKQFVFALGVLLSGMILAMDKDEPSFGANDGHVRLVSHISPTTSSSSSSSVPSLVQATPDDQNYEDALSTVTPFWKLVNTSLGCSPFLFATLYPESAELADASYYKIAKKEDEQLFTLLDKSKIRPNSFEPNDPVKADIEADNYLFFDVEKQPIVLVGSADTAYIEQFKKFYEKTNVKMEELD